MISGPRSNGFTGIPWASVGMPSAAATAPRWPAGPPRAAGCRGPCAAARVLAADHHDVAEDLLERPGQLRTARRRAADHPAQEPARPVGAQEPQRLGRLWPAVLARLAHHGHHLGAEWPVVGCGLAAGIGHGLHQFPPDLIPQPAGLGRRERLQLQPAVAGHHRDPDPGLLIQVHLDVEALPDRYQQAAEIQPLALGVGGRRVPRPAAVVGPRRRAGPVVAQPGPGGGVAQVLAAPRGGPAELLVLVLADPVRVVRGRQLVIKVRVLVEFRLIAGPGQLLLIPPSAAATARPAARVLAAASSEHPARSFN